MRPKRGENAGLTKRFVQLEENSRPIIPLFGKYVTPHIGTVSRMLEEESVKAIRNREHLALILIISAVAKVYGFITKWKHLNTWRLKWKHLNTWRL